MTQFKHMIIGQLVWIAVFWGDKFMPLYAVGRVGDCIR
jgi:hypothetical protein